MTQEEAFYADIHPKLIEWAQEALNCDIDKTEIAHSSLYSYCLKISVKTGDFFLKHESPIFFKEAQVLRILNKAPNRVYVPRLIKINSGLNAFIMARAGDETLRSCFEKNGFCPDKMTRGLRNYIAIQKQSYGLMDQLHPLEIPDWRLEKIPLMYRDFISDTHIMKVWGIDDQTRHKLETICPRIEKAASRLEALTPGIRNVLNNSDFSDNNITIDVESGDCYTIDWAETHIGHPFLSLRFCLWGLADRYGLPVTSKDYQALKREMLNGYSVRAQDADEIYNLTTLLAPVYFVLSFQDLMQKSGFDYPNWAGKNRAALLTLIERVD